MIALIRYSLASMLHAQRYLAPVLLFLAILAVLTINDQGSLAAVYVVCAGGLFVCSAWLTITLINMEDPVHRAVTIVNAGRSRTVLIATTCLALIVCLALTGVGMVFPLFSGRHVVTAAGLVVGLEAQLACVFVGVGVGLLCSRLVIGRPGYSLVVALILVMVLPLTPGLPPVNPMLKLMSNGRPAAELVTPVTGYLAISVVLLLVAGTVTQLVAARRD